MVVEHMFTRFWEQLMSRPAGPMKFRFILQPAMAIFLAVRCGLKDSHEGKPAFFWALFTDPVHRWQLLRDGWKSIRSVFILALVLDGAYQLIELRWIYPGEALAVALVLAIIPYLLVRGPVNRIATACKPLARPSAVKQSQDSSPEKKVSGL
jgi:hypothetical protein